MQLGLVTQVVLEESETGSLEWKRSDSSDYEGSAEVDRSSAWELPEGDSQELEAGSDRCDMGIATC